jgi:hypothetical protein
MRIAITATVAAGLALLAANMLGVASAEAPTPTTTTSTTPAPAPVPVSAPLRTMSVQGVAGVSLAQGSNAADATAAYRQGMAAAVADGQGKAEFLAGKVGATLGSVQSVTEGGGSIECKDEESNYVSYEGEQPDFGTTTERFVAPPEAAASAPPRKVARKRRRTRRPTAKKATASTASTCTLSAQVSLVYALD